MKYDTIEGTTTASGAIIMPTKFQRIPLFGVYLVEGGPGLVFRRDVGYFTCYKSTISEGPRANTSVKIRVWYYGD